MQEKDTKPKQNAVELFHELGLDDKGIYEHFAKLAKSAEIRPWRQRLNEPPDTRSDTQIDDRKPYA